MKLTTSSTQVSRTAVASAWGACVRLGASHASAPPTSATSGSMMTHTASAAPMARRFA